MKDLRSEISNKITSILMAHDVRKQDAEITADVLIEGTSRGYFTHGVNRIHQILDGIKQGTINPKTQPKLLKNNSANAVFDGNFGLGQVVGKKAMELAVKKAKKVGVGIVGVINSSHLGILAYYSEIASQDGCIGLVMTTSSPAVVVKGGVVKTFGTNPISYSIPHNPHPITADFATSKVSRGLVYDYLSQGKKIPSGWAVDKNGKNTKSPKKALEGGLQTLDGDIKGSLLSFLVSILAGNLIGGVINPHVTGTRYMNEKPNKGDLFMAFDIEHFTNMGLFSKSLKELVDFIKNQSSEFRIPGTRSFEERRKFLNDAQFSINLDKFI